MVASMTCPICSKVVPATAVQDSRYFPFCSERCRNVDLLRWSKGEYAIVETLQPQHLEQVGIDLEALDDEAS